MDKELKSKWVAALRSGEIKQGRGGLLDYTGAMCCLGVLERVCGTDDKTIRKYADFLSLPINTGQDDRRVIDGERAYHGVPLEIRNDLADMNDGRRGDQPKSFAEIADWIEANL